MSGPLPISVPLPLVRAAQEGATQGTLRAWERSSLDGLFESHLTPTRQQSQPIPDPARSSQAPRVATTQDGPRLARDSKSSSALPDAPATGASGPDQDAAATPNFRQSLQAGLMVQPDSVPYDSSAPNDPDPREKSAQLIEAPVPEQNLVLVLAESQAEVYIRDRHLAPGDGEDLQRAMHELLGRHQVALGRVRLNGLALEPADSVSIGKRL